MVLALVLSLLKNRTLADVTFVFDGQEVKAHKAVLADRCDYFKQFFDLNKCEVIKLEGTSFKLFNEVVNFCYLQQIDIANWSYNEKQCLYELASAYNYGPLMDFVKIELDKRPEVPLSVDTLNEWYNNSPGEELREWIKNNTLNITNYEECHEYSKDLVLLILDTFNKMYEKEGNKCKLLTVQIKTLLWLFRWRNWSNRNEEDVRSPLLKIRLPMVLTDRALRHKTLQKKSSIETNDGSLLMSDSYAITAKYETAIKDFVLFRKLDTVGWTCHEILQLLGCAKDYEFGPLLDEVLNAVATQYLKPSTFATIFGVACKLESSELEQVLIDYLKNNTMSVCTSTEFTNYPGSVVEFILDYLKDKVMEMETKWLIFIAIDKWIDSNGKREVKKVRNNVQCQDFIDKLIMDFFIKPFKDEDSKDVTLVFGEQEIKAHKRVLAYSCDTFKQLFDRKQDNRIDMEGTRLEPFNQLVNYCYRQKIDLTGWGYSDKRYLYNLALKYRCWSLMNVVQTELQKRPTVPLGVESLNEWYYNCPDEEIREWVKNNQLIIVDYEDCHKYSEDLVVLIMDTFCELCYIERSKQKLEIPQMKLLMWLSRWRNSSTRKAEEVQRVLAKIKMPLLLKDRALTDRTLQQKLINEVRRFNQIRKVDTAGWTCDDVLELLFLAHDNELGPLVDAVLNVVATQYLKPASLRKIHQLTSRLESNKLQQIMSDYIQNHIIVILTSAEFTSYPASLVGLILEKLSVQVMDKQVKNQLLTSIWDWKTSKSEEEVKAVFTKIQWEDFSRKQLARVLRIVIPEACLGNISGLAAPAEGKGAKRKQRDNSENLRRGCPRKE